MYLYRNQGKRAFTLIELLVVISIISLLMAILVPALGKVKDNARRVVCGSSLHQIGISLGTYSAQNRGKLPKPVPNDRDPFKYHHYFRDTSNSGNFVLVGNSFSKKYIGQKITQTALFALIADKLLNPEFLFCPAAKGRNQINYTKYLEFMKKQNAKYPETLDSRDFIIDTLSNQMLKNSFAFGYCYWPGYEVVANSGHNSESKLNRFRRSVAKNGNSDANTVAVTDLIITKEISEGAAKEPATLKNLMGEAYADNHIRGGSISGGNVLYNDGSVRWQNMSSLISDKISTATDEDAFKRCRITIKTNPMGDAFNYWF